MPKTERRVVWAKHRGSEDSTLPLHRMDPKLTNIVVTQEFDVERKVGEGLV